MDPSESCPQGGGSIEICLSSAVKEDTTNTVGHEDEPNIEPMSDVEMAVKTENSPSGGSTDEACKTLEDITLAFTPDANGETEANLDADDGDRVGELSNSSDIRPIDEFLETGEVNGDEDAASSGKSLGDSDIRPIDEFLEDGEVNGDEDAVSSGKSSGDSESHDSESADSADSAEPEPAVQASDVIRNKSDMELEYDMDDPLEFARQLAIEVEREVEDCGEESSSSSDEAPESLNQLTDNPANEPQSGACLQEDLSKEAQSGEHRDERAENLADKPANATQEIESSQVTNVNQEVSADAEKSVCNFDLNEEICVEKTDDLENQISTPVAVGGSASIAATVSGMAGSPFQFEGNLGGWKGSAATSAFHSVNGNNNSSKKRENCLDIDLNTRESCFDEPAAIEATTEWPNLDLNSATDDVVVDDGTSDRHFEGQIHPLSNGYHNFASSSSSSSKQPMFSSIDLNDQPSFVSDHYGRSVANKSSNDSVISIMGVKVEVNKHNSSMSNSHPFLNGWDPMPPVDASSSSAQAVRFLGTESAVPYAYTGLTSFTAGGTSSAVYGQYGQFPYMFDSVGAPVIPQAQPGYHQPHLMMGMGMGMGMGMAMPGSNGVGPSGFSLDLNAGSVVDGNRDNGGIRQYLYTQPPTTANLVAGMKRREPDSGWEPELFPYKHHQPTWK